MGQRITGLGEAREAKDLLDRAISLLDASGLALIATQAHQARQLLDDWLLLPTPPGLQPTFIWVDNASAAMGDAAKDTAG